MASQAVITVVTEHGFKLQLLGHGHVILPAMIACLLKIWTMDKLFLFNVMPVNNGHGNMIILQ